MPIPMSAVQIAEDMEERIYVGEYPAGSRLPTYRELADLYGVGMTTISTVVIVLKSRGLVVGSQGRGTYVAERLP